MKLLQKILTPVDFTDSSMKALQTSIELAGVFNSQISLMHVIADDNIPSEIRKILDEKAKVCFGSDNMPLDPLLGIWSVAAHPIDGIRITAEEALYNFTLGAAYSSFEEDIKGSIEVGKLADFVILDKDILTIKPDEIKNAKVLATIFNGEIVYGKL